MRKAAFVFTWVFLAVCCQGRIIYVDGDAGGANDGTSWANAYNYLQDALADANSDPNVDEIWVAQGTYTPDSNSADPNGSGHRTATFRLENGVILRGGYAGFGEPDPNAWDPAAYETILSGDLKGDDDSSFANYGENSYHVVTGSGINANTLLDGLTITAGNASSPSWYGGGMYNSANARLTNCTFTRNRARWSGGGMYNKNGKATVTNCTFSENRADDDGGGMYNNRSTATVTNCTFTENRGAHGGGMYNGNSSATVTNCTFTGNSGWWLGGGMHNKGGKVTITNCTFSGNLTATAGGGVYNKSNTTLTKCALVGNWAALSGGGMYNYRNATLTNCAFSGNSAESEYGGGLMSYGNATLTNCTFVGNWAALDGGGIGSYGGSSATLTNCTFSGNLANGLGGAMDSAYSTATLTNCILWGDTADANGAEIALRSTALTISYSDVEGGQAAVYVDPNSTLNWETGNIDADPCFVEAGDWDANDTPEDTNDDFWVEGDYRLLEGSPCIDAGDRNYIPEPNETDLDGKARVIDGDEDGVAVVDMGAYEYSPPLEVEMKLVPRMLNCASRGRWVKVHIIFPEEIFPEDIDVNEPAVAEPMDVESQYIKVIGNGEGPVRLEVGFDREVFCEAAGDGGEVEVTVFGWLTSGREFYGTDTIRITHRR